MDWLAAQENDGEFISDHARNIPFQEDIAETFLVHLAVDHRRDRISQALFDTVVQTVTNRLASQGLNRAYRLQLRPKNLFSLDSIA
ncbi:MAG: hypothetical protein ACI92G_001570 [Candidatus Pelagisphaera sp.]|jgi:hypothetical protein